MPQVLLALGSNVGDRMAHMIHAVHELALVLDVQAASRVYETAPMYVEDQAAFFNAALLARTHLAPLELLRRFKAVEAQTGRSGSVRYGPREIDIDLIAYGCLAYYFEGSDAKGLQVPHPRVVERRFVLAPLRDVAPDFVLPGYGRVTELLDRTNDQSDDVRVVEDAILPVQRK